MRPTSATKQRPPAVKGEVDEQVFPIQSTYHFQNDCRSNSEGTGDTNPRFCYGWGERHKQSDASFNAAALQSPEVPGCNSQNPPVPLLRLQHPTLNDLQPLAEITPLVKPGGADSSPSKEPPEPALQNLPRERRVIVSRGFVANLRDTKRIQNGASSTFLAWCDSSWWKRGKEEEAEDRWCCIHPLHPVSMPTQR